MDGSREREREAKSLLTRTMSFKPVNLSISAKARALRDRFANNKRSLSDTWKDLEESCDDKSESDLSLLKTSACSSSSQKNTNTNINIEVVEPIVEGKSYNMMSNQRSKSLDSLNKANQLEDDLKLSTDQFDLPSPTLLGTPTLSPVNAIFPVSLDFIPTSISPRPRPASFRHIRQHNEHSFQHASSSSLPQSILLPPPPSKYNDPLKIEVSSVISATTVPLLLIGETKNKCEHINKSESMDSEELRDTISDKPLRHQPPSNLFCSDIKPKLKHQWSMDESCSSSNNKQIVNDMPLRPAEKRRRFFMRKQTNSAPDSFEGPPTIQPKATKEHHSVSFCLGSVLRSRTSTDSHNIPPPTIMLQNKLNSEPELGVEHLSDLSYPDADPPCHFCCKQSSTSIHDENRLKIVSRGLVRSRDGSREGGGTHYMNLPSPNVQSEGSHEDVFKSHRASSTYTEDDFSRRESCITPPPIPGRRRRTEELDLEEIPSTPPASVLARRRALVPPKLMSDDMNPDSSERKLSGGSSSDGPRTRRSSIVVIPPMQICPGDLLVYSKVLTTQRNTHLLEIQGSISSIFFSDNSDGVSSRKNKTTWSLLKLFDRGNRGKSESLCGLEEVLSCIQRSEFHDEQLSKFRGMCWSDFVVFIDTDKCVRHSSSSSSSAASSPERTSIPIPLPILPLPIVETKSVDKLTGMEKRLRIGLMRTQSEKSFEKRLTGVSGIWRGLPERVLPRPAPLIPTLSEKDLLGSKEALASPVSTISRNESKRREALWDLFQSECAFLYDHLMVLKNVFMEPLKSIQVEGFAMFAEPELLFGNLDELCCVTYAFCKEFINLILQNVGVGGEMNTTEILVKLFQKSTKADSVSQAYHCYALNYINALNYLETLRRHVEFCQFEKWCNRDPRCKKLQLTDLLVAPVQHIMKVPLILKEIENRTEDSEERESIVRILEMEENSLRELDDKMKWLKNFERLLEIQRNIVWPSVLELDPKMYVPEFLKPALAKQPCDRIIVSPRRQIIMEGPLNLWDSGKASEMHVVLFDDMLLITRKKKGLSKKKSSLTENWPSSCSRASTSGESAVRYVVYKQPLSLDRFFIHDVTVPEGSACRLEAAFVLVSLNRFQQIVAVHTFQAASDQLKQTWLLKLRDTQDKWKRTLQQTVFRSPRLSTCSSRKSTA